ncbi:MAG: hypothetical protein J6Z18_09010 [Prevotella sp.]|nr:hypothetical protein [Prevotella sp.]
MKKIIYSVLMMFMVAMTFTSCADVPMPYDDPNQSAIDNEGSVVEPEGIGTADDPYNVAAANALIESGEAPETNVYVKGKIVSIREIDTASYGNATFYISDDGSSKDQLTVYRSKSLGNKPFKSEEEIQDGDEVIICGVLVNFNGTYEFTQGCYIYSRNGETSGGGAVGTPTGSGTLDDPYNVAAIIGVASALPSNGKSDNVYFKGKVSTIEENYSTQFGNATFYISDDGTNNGEFYVYRALYLGNREYTTGADLLKEGDEVILYGKVTNYQGNTPETSQKECFLYSLNGKSEGGGGGGGTEGVAKGSGTLEDPYNAVAATNEANKLENSTAGDKDVYIKGKIVSIKEEFSTTHGNSSFYISDDGTANNQFYVYRTLYFGNKLYESGELPKVGDEVVICGKLYKYVSNGTVTPETQQNQSYIYSLNGKTEPGSGGGGGGGSSTGDFTRSVSDNILTITMNGVTASSNKITVDFSAQGWTNQQTVTSATVTLSDGTTISFNKNTSSGTGSDPAYYDGTKGVRLYAKNQIIIKGANKGIAKVVMTCDKQGSNIYVGNETLTASSSGNTLTITNEYGLTSGGVQLRIQTMEITYAE